MTDIAAKNPADTEIADKLADAKEQLETAQDALTDATSQKSVIENATTPAEVEAARDQATTDGDTATKAAEASAQDVTDAQTKV